MTVLEVRTQDEMDRVLQNEFVVIDFSAPAWCVPCQRLAPHYKKVAEVLTDVVFVHVDIDEAEKALIDEYGVQSVPTVIGYFGGNPSPVSFGREFHSAPALLREVQGRVSDAESYNR